MPIAVPLNAPKLAGWALKQAGIPVHIKTSMFFDRAHVVQALTRAERRFLSRSSLLVRRTAAKSIKKMGGAKPPLKVVGLNSGLSLSQIASLPGMTTQRAGIQRDSRGRYAKGSGAMRSRAGFITESDRRKVIERIREMQEHKASRPGTPPHTHVPSSFMLGFRRNIYNAVDMNSLSAVVGPSKKGDDYMIPHIHEFGDSQKLRAWALKPPPWKKNPTPVIKWVSTKTRMTSRWHDTGATRTEGYPKRPFMGPALENSRPKIAQFFRDAFQ
jgi:hypothetical protein